ncbi:hypothetical protein ACFXG4_03935 [Nocardia sp. NPDC059246]|uniref:hypothetical protein n=1 Tax=unclassified Nocardia TaxID=2637762 RepID=UPI00369F9422
MPDRDAILLRSAKARIAELDTVVGRLSRELDVAQARVAELEQQAKKRIRSVQVEYAFDLWMALGCPTNAFYGYLERNGIADTWANLLAVVRDTFRPKCGQPTDGGPCVLSEHEIGPCYSREDVGVSESVPHAARIAELEARQEPLGYAVAVYPGANLPPLIEDVHPTLESAEGEAAELRKIDSFTVDRRVYELREVIDRG